MKRIAAGFLMMAALFWTTSAVLAEADGPDYWDVSGVRAHDVLNLRTEATTRSTVITGIPYDATGLRNLGCSGGPTFSEWQRMSAAERERSARDRWCKVEYQGRDGWVAGRFLKESAAAPERAGSQRSGSTQASASTIGPWKIVCSATCRLEQRGVGSQRPSLLRLEPREGNNAEISIIRAGMPQQGTLSIYMDGETITQGPIAQLTGKGDDRLVLTPDDITAGLLRQMARHKNMVLSFPGEERGVEIRLDRFADAWEKAQR